MKESKSAAGGKAQVDSGPPAQQTQMAAFSNSQFRWLYTSNMGFFTAMSGQAISRQWLAWELTNSKIQLGLIGFAVAIPMLLLGPFGGVIADRVDRRKLIAIAQTLVLISEVTVLALMLTGRLQYWHLLAAAGVMGSMFPFMMPARQAIVANIVGRSGLSNAMALNLAGVNLTRVIGPPVTGMMIAAFDVQFAYAMNIVLYLVAVLCVLKVHRADPPEDARDLSPLRSLVEGFQYIRENRLVLLLLFFGLIPMFLVMPFQNLLVVFTDEVWNVGSAGFGLISGVAGAGGVLGSMYVAWTSDSTRRQRRMLVSMVGFGSFLFGFAVSPYFLLAIPLVLVANACSSVYSTLNNTAIQLLIPDRVRGRVSSFLMMSFSLPMLGVLPMSVVAEAYGAPAAVASASVIAVVVGFAFYLGSSTLRGMDKALRDSMREEA